MLDVLLSVRDTDMVLSELSMLPTNDWTVII